MGLSNYFKASKKEDGKAGKDAEKTTGAALQSLPPRLYQNSTAANSRVTLDEGLRDDIKHQVILNFLYQKQRGQMWIDPAAAGINEGVMVRKTRQEYICQPSVLAESPFARAMAVLNVQAAMTINSSVIEPFLSWSPDAVDIPLLNGLRVQILPSFEDLYRARRHQYAAFIASGGLLVVWDDDPTKLFDRAKAIEDELLQVVWQTPEDLKNEKMASANISEIDVESGPMIDERPVMYLEAFLASCSICLMVVLLGLGYSEIALEVAVLQTWTSLALIVMTPIYIFLSLFFTNVVVKTIAQFIGPIQQMSRNSRYFSANPPTRLRENLPHVTIQCPVYKEGLASVIAPTVLSIKKAISTYELQGGSANIFINDDGMQIISEQDRQERIDFYADHGIGWTARPGHNVDGYVRKGRFKKASNMNFGLTLSNQVEEKLQMVPRPPGWSQSDEALAYEQCLKQVLEEDGRAWADGYIRVGDYILIIDSDTRVPEDCLLDAASEMEQSPEVAIIQFSSGVMQVSYNFFENGITFFTNLIYTAIRYGVANGDVAAFVGHNAILRWSAVQEVAFLDEDGVERFWSESCVSEDFDMALRLQLNRYVIRMAAWANNGFQEGVSLTVYDELTRWQKYAYGCNELVFYPVRQWFYKGPFTPLFKRFLGSGINIGSKINMIAYIGTYYAIGSAWIITLANYVAVGLYNGYLDKYYLDSWKNWVAIIVVFGVAGNCGLAVQRHRSGEKTFLMAFLENFKWALMFALFFGGLSLHMSQAILCHMFDVPLSWGATSKEVEFSNFFLEVPKVLKNFKYTFIMCITCIIGMIVMATATFIPWSYNIDAMVAIFPLAVLCVSHLLLPIALNPEMMTFSW